MAAGLFNIWLADGEDGNVMDIIKNEHDTGTISDWTVAEKLVPFFILTEFVPALAFIYQVDIFSKVFTREDERAQEEQRQRMLQRELDMQRAEAQRELQRRENNEDEESPSSSNSAQNGNTGLQRESHSSGNETTVRQTMDEDNLAHGLLQS